VKAKARLPILIVQHAPHEHPAAVRRALESQGIATQCIHPYLGENYPEAREVQGMISLGGPMSANDEAEHPWIQAEIRLLKACIEAGLPTVGICLGGQMMARAMGGRVERHHTQEIGWFPLETNAAGLADPVMGAAGSSPTVYHWHGDTFHLPPGAELLAASKACPRQAYRLGDRAYGFQFHPEADHQLIGEWMGCEGIDEEIHEIQRQFGPETVQDARTQIEHALRGEKASLKITAAIGGLFRRKDETAAIELCPEELESWVTHRTPLRLAFEGSDRRENRLQGRISALLDLHAGELGEILIFQEENTLLWPVRLADVRSLEPVTKAAKSARPPRLKR
jgi:GMP synthase (glutamine-hydrolysing)